MTILTKYNQWLGFDQATKSELQSIQDSRAEITDRFYRDLEFGTGGLRGVMGAGTNRMNRYTVRRATLSLARYLQSQSAATNKVAIAYDSRNNSREFAIEAAGVLCAAGIRVALFEKLMPTPVLSYAVRQLGCQAGIVITASHNPKEYNGYKVYDQTGCQVLPDTASLIIEQVNAITEMQMIPVLRIEEAQQAGLFDWIGDDVLDNYLLTLDELSLYSKKTDLRIVYTPLHGTGYFPVFRILVHFNPSIVIRQMMPDGNFSTVRSPNPEERDALTMAIEQAKAENADLVLGTDPDCDRVGVAVRHQDEYILLTGNQIGALLVDFVVRNRKFGKNNFLVKTIVTNELGAMIGLKAGLQVEETLTGFKYIGDKINGYEKSGDKSFVIGYEESFGFLVGTHARDKDAVVASMLIAEMAAWHKKKGRTLVDRLEELYREFGYYLDGLDSFTLKGKDGAERIQAIMAEIRAKGKDLIPGVREVKDYNNNIDGLPSENVVKFVLEDGSWVAVRPSGTEPKVKVYYGVRGDSREMAEGRLKGIREVVGKVVGT